MTSRPWLPLALRPAPRRPIRRLKLESLEARETPATLDVVGGVVTFTATAGETNALTVVLNNGLYRVIDTGATIDLGAGAIAAGWSGSGTGIVRGLDISVNSIAVNLGDGNDTFDLRSTRDAVTVRGDTGDDTIRLSSNGAALTGHLDGINAAVSVVANAGSDTMILSDYAAVAGNSNAVVGSSSITGLAGARNNRTVTYTTSGGGSFAQVRVIGSNSAALAETFTLNNAGAPVLLETNGGADDVTVLALSGTATVQTGAGNDSIVVSSSGTVTAGNLDGINATLTINAGPGRTPCT